VAPKADKDENDSEYTSTWKQRHSENLGRDGTATDDRRGRGVRRLLSLTCADGMARFVLRASRAFGPAWGKIWPRLSFLCFSKLSSFLG